MAGRHQQHTRFVAVLLLGTVAILGERATSTTIVSWYRNRELIDFAGSFRQEAKRSNAPDDDIAFGRDRTVPSSERRSDGSYTYPEQRLR